MTILPKKKEKQESDSDGDHTSHAHSHSGAAAHSSPHRNSDDEESFSHSADAYYHRHYDSCDDEDSSGVAVSKRGYHPPTASATPARTKRAEGGSPYASGYNSSEEYDVPRRADPEMERNFELTLKKRGFILKRMREDGACLFRAVADQVYGDQEMHSVVRNHCLDYMMKNADYFSQFITEDFEGYISRKRSDHCFGNNLEMQAMAEMYNRVIELYQYGSEPINIFFGVYKTDNAPIRLSYHGGIHYNSVVDPHAATIGVGLGLAGYKPGHADKTLISGAMRESENVFLEQAMLEDKLKSTDWDATYEAVEDAVARESYLQWLKDSEKRSSSSKSGAQGSSMACASNTTTVPSSSTSSPSLQVNPLVPAHAPLPAIRFPVSEDAKQSSKQRGGASSRTNSPARSRSPARSHHHSHHGVLPSATTTSRNNSPSRTSVHGSPHTSRHGSPCEARHRGGGSARGSPRTSPRNSPSNSPSNSHNGSPSGSRHGSPTSVRHCAAPALLGVRIPSPEQSGANGGSRKSPPSSPKHLPPLVDGQLGGAPPVSHAQAEAVSQQPSSLHTPDFESGAVLDKLPFEYSSFLDLSSSAFGLQEWEDDRILAAVLAASQQEYIDHLKQNARTVDRGSDGV